MVTEKRIVRPAMNRNTVYSAVKIDVSDVSPACDSKVLVLAHESNTRDVVTTLLHKLKMRDVDSSLYVIEAEILVDKDLAILQFDEEDKLMQAYHQFPKGAMRLCLRHKSDFGMDIADEKRGKTGVNGHQLTLQRIRRSLEKLKRKSGTNPTIGAGKSTSSGGTNTNQDSARGRSVERDGSQSARVEKVSSNQRAANSEAPPTPRSARPPITPQSPTRVKSQGVSASTNVNSPRSLVQSTPLTPRGQQRFASKSAVTSSQDNVTSPQQQKQNGGTVMSDRRRELRNRTDRTRRRSHAGTDDGNTGYKSPYGLSKQLSYKAASSNFSGSKSGAMSDTECMIFYDSSSEHSGSMSHLPSSNLSPSQNASTSHNSLATAGAHRSHVIAHAMPVEAQHGRHLMIDKPTKLQANPRTLEDSGIDVKSPPTSGGTNRIREHVHSVTDMDYTARHNHTPTRESGTNTHGNSVQCENYVSPTLSDFSPYSVTESPSGGNHVTRTGSFSSLKSLPVTVYQEPGESPYMFEQKLSQDRLRAKSQSMTNLHGNKVVRRRSLPPLDVSQEKLEQKKTSLSKRLAKKISNFRSNDKRYMLPSPHTFGSQSLQHFKNPPERSQSLSDNRRKPKPEIEIEDDADMEVACILEGKPEHPTDSDVEDYLACVESTNTTQSESRHEDLESTPNSFLEQTENQSNYTKQKPKSSSNYYENGQVIKGTIDHNKNNYVHSLNSGHQHKMSPSQNDGYVNVEQYIIHNNFTQSIDSGIDGRADTQKHPAENVNKKDKHLNKFVEQSMKSFLNDCHQPNESEQGELVDPHLHHTMPPSPYRDSIETNQHKMSSVKTKLSSGNERRNSERTDAGASIKSPLKATASLETVALHTHQSRLSTEKNAGSGNLTAQNETKASSGQAMSEYEKARARFLQMSQNSGAQNGGKSLAFVRRTPTEAFRKTPENSGRGVVNDKPNDFNNRTGVTNAKADDNTSKTVVHDKPNDSSHTATDGKFKSNIQLRLQPKLNSPDDVFETNDVKTQKDSTSLNALGNNASTKSMNNIQTAVHKPPTPVRKTSLPSETLIGAKSSEISQKPPTSIRKNSWTSEITTSANSAVISRSANTINNAQSSISQTDIKQTPTTKTSPSIEISDEEWASKPLTLFAIIRTHSILALHLEKIAGNRSFGIKVHKALFTSSGQIKDASVTVLHNAVAVQELSQQTPAGGSTGRLAINDVIIELNGHNVLQSSDKVVRTLLDARSVLEIVIARAKSSPQLLGTPTDKNISPSSSKSNSSPLVFHNMNDIQADASSNRAGVEFSHVDPSRSKGYESRSKVYEQRSRAYEQEVDGIVTSPRFSQLSEGPTFLL